MSKYIGYYRTSTHKQNLGIEAQKTAVKNYLKSIGGELVGEVSEQESGKNDKREGLEKAIRLCEKNGCTLIIAKLDRLSRCISFLFQLRDRVAKSNIEIKALDMPSFNTMSLGIYATMAQAEREAISLRTRLALAERKRQGLTLGSPQNLTIEAQKKGIESIRLKARSNDQNRQAQVVISGCISNGMTYSATAIYLNNLNFLTSKGKHFRATTVMRLQKRQIDEQTHQMSF
ncbi:recombinase family protein [Flavobacterium sp.]|uniref:recombinase family protein n=1 Tax=Flavobacterium sp. TaxID=239 RepID=UPI0026179A24|nr:recombinase family protein [Flavobacterium sp.]